MKKKTQKTNAMRSLGNNKIDYKIHEYPQMELVPGELIRITEGRYADITA